MTRRLRPLLLGLALSLAALPATAACYADYRAKMDDPLRLHYGVIELPDTACSADAAGPVIAGRIAAEGWELLEVISVFDDSGLDARRSDAGDHFLRY
jgi:hypothetical protein